MKFVIYKAKDGWRWRAIARNSKVVADGAEGYARKSGAQKALKKFRTDAATAEVIEAE